MPAHRGAFLPLPRRHSPVPPLQTGVLPPKRAGPPNPTSGHSARPLGHLWLNQMTANQRLLTHFHEMSVHQFVQELGQPFVVVAPITRSAIAWISGLALPIATPRPARGSSECRSRRRRSRRSPTGRCRACLATCKMPSHLFTAGSKTSITSTLYAGTMRPGRPPARRTADQVRPDPLDLGRFGTDADADGVLVRVLAEPRHAVDRGVRKVHPAPGGRVQRDAAGHQVVHPGGRGVLQGQGGVAFGFEELHNRGRAAGPSSSGEG